MAGLLGVGRMNNVEDGASELSSSSISSPPISPHQTTIYDTIHVNARPQTGLQISQRDGVVNASSAAPARAAPPTQTLNATQPDKPKRQRKKKELDPDGKPKEKKPRKPREPKDRTAANGTPTTNPRKKVKVEDKTVESSTAAAAAAAAAPRKSNIMDLIGKSTPVNAPSAMTNLASTPQTAAPISSLQPPPNTPAARPISSGQRYDPVRAAMMEAALQNTSVLQHTAPVHRASASPSIASLIDPPARSSAATPSLLRSPQNTNTQSLLLSSPQQQPSAFNNSHQPPISPSPSVARVAAVSNVMDIDSATPSFKSLTKEEATIDLKTQSKPPSAAPTPKAAPPRSSPPAPKGTGSGLLSTSDLFGGSSSNGVLERKGVNIDIHISLNPAGSNHINVAQEITKKYGRDALYPRVAAHREELLQVMSASKNLGTGSADDMSLDLNSDMEDDSNVEMGGMDDTGDGDKPRKRRKKVEDYDLDDEFIDDTELAWQQEAAVAKDGFFVYSGPLLVETEVSRAEAASSSTRGGRGRGRGRGRGAASSTSHASLAEKKDNALTAGATTAGATSGRGRGGRGRGTGAPRKPRITKADKERMEAEKTSRERAAIGMGLTTTATTTAAPLVSSTTYVQATGTTA